MSDTIEFVPKPSSYYYESELVNTYSFLNSVYALDIAIEQNFADMLFYSDLSRIVYASTEYCFKRRTEMSSEGVLFPPFMNYYLKSITPDTDRFLWKNTTNVQPLLNLDEYVTSLGFGLKVVPVHLVYEANAWFSQDRDLQFATSQVLFQNTNEIILYGMLNITEDYDLKNPAFMKYNLDFKPQYTENEWLETNNITSLAMDFEFDTFAVYTDISRPLMLPRGTPKPVYIANEIIFNFLSTKGNLSKDSNLLQTSPQELITSYFNV